MLIQKTTLLNYEHTYKLSKFDTMATLTVEIDKERDLPALQELLTKMGLEYQIEEDIDEDDDWDDLPEEAIEGIKAGMADVAAGRVHTHEEVRAHINKKIEGWRKKNA